MTSRTTRPVRLTAFDADGRTCLDHVIGHGEDPDLVLWQGGWRRTRVRDVSIGVHQVAIAVDVTALKDSALSTMPGEFLAQEMLAELPSPPDEPLDPGEVAVRHQRVGAHAVVRSAGKVLLTQYSQRTNTAGRWGLPGGGLEPGETVRQGVVREVWEETGQQVVPGPMLTLLSQHWIGRAPDGVMEDYHALGVVCEASCDRPTPVIVHDIDGTTSAVAWVDDSDLSRIPLGNRAVRVFRELGLLTV